MLSAGGGKRVENVDTLCGYICLFIDVYLNFLVFLYLLVYRFLSYFCLSISQSFFLSLFLYLSISLFSINPPVNAISLFYA